MKILKSAIIELVKKSSMPDELHQKLEDQDYEYVYVALLNEGLLSFDEYKRLRKEYYERNKYLPIIQITSPRAFGETWAEKHITETIPQFEAARNIKGLKTQGMYDVVYRKDVESFDDVIKMEVKAGRAIDRSMHNMPYDRRALISDEVDRKFDMNFQQMKPDCFDVAILIGVWTDKIRYWVFSSNEMREHKHFSSGQHRGNKGYEGQIHIKTENLQDFSQFEVEESEIFETVLRKAGR